MPSIYHIIDPTLLVALWCFNAFSSETLLVRYRICEQRAAPTNPIITNTQLRVAKVKPVAPAKSIMNVQDKPNIKKTKP